jgi:hypothetical protein
MATFPLTIPPNNLFGGCLCISTIHFHSSSMQHVVVLDVDILFTKLLLFFFFKTYNLYTIIVWFGGCLCISTIHFHSSSMQHVVVLDVDILFTKLLLLFFLKKIEPIYNNCMVNTWDVEANVEHIYGRHAFKIQLLLSRFEP